MNKIDKNFWKYKKVLITGSTGFKGTWLVEFLKNLSCDVYGISNTKKRSILDQRKKFFFLNICDKSKLYKVINFIKPEIIFHLAAQPIVMTSYKKPDDTFNTNINGLINLLEIIKKMDCVKSTIIVTSDKCYKVDGHKVLNLSEESHLGGNDPYSASKACAEIISNSYYFSYLKNSQKKRGIATARAGNVIGGGDKSKNRIIPDIINSILNKKNIYIRRPHNTRPWQHVLDVVYGYILLAENLYKKPKSFSGAWNFASSSKKEITVLNLVKYFCKDMTYKKKIIFYDSNVHEEKSYKICSKKSKKYLGWKPIYTAKNSILLTSNWYKNFIYDKISPQQLTQNQVIQYLNLLEI
jgi:CDP-glucose 4,6-dehydratase